LGIPETVQEIVIKRDGTSVVENDCTVFPRYGSAPPLVVDSPAFPDRVYLAGGLARESNMFGFPMLVGAHGHDLGLPEGPEPGSMAQGSKLISA
jgi:hypothetical protein